MTAALATEDRQARDQKIVALTRAGHSAPSIATQLGIAERTVQRVRVRTGIAAPIQFTPMTDDENRRAAELLDDGASFCEVARTLGRSYTTIQRRFNGRSCWRQGGGADYRHAIAMLDAIVPPLKWGAL